MRNASGFFVYFVGVRYTNGLAGIIGVDAVLGEQALQRMRGLIGFSGHWTDILSYLPDGWTDDPKKRRSATASTFAASLELAKEGKIVIRQDEIFSSIQIKRAERDG